MDDKGSVTHWIDEIKKGESAAATALWELYFAKLVRLARGPLEVAASGVCFNTPDDNDETLWPSDHAGVWADLSWAN